MLGLVALGTCAFVLVVGLFKHQPLIQMIFVAVSLAVSAIPE